METKEKIYLFLISLAVSFIVPEVYKIVQEYRQDTISPIKATEQSPSSSTTETINVHHALKLFTQEELSTFTGEKGSPGIYLAILGHVYDVQVGAKHYGPGSTYNIFVG